MFLCSFYFFETNNPLRSELKARRLSIIYYMKREIIELKKDHENQFYKPQGSLDHDSSPNNLVI